MEKGKSIFISKFYVCRNIYILPSPCYNDFMELPKDPAMRMSYLNTKLRDEYGDINALCDDFGIKTEDLLHGLEEDGLVYDPVRRRVEFA